MLKDGVKLMSEQKRKKTSMGDVTSREWKLEKEQRKPSGSNHPKINSRVFPTTEGYVFLYQKDSLRAKFSTFIIRSQ